MFGKLALPNVGKRPGQWTPRNRGYWCAYDQRIVTILSCYHLEVTAANRSAMQQVLRRR